MIAETARIAIAKHRSVVERDVDVIVQRARRGTAPDAQRARHAEMHEQRAVARVEQQVLAPALDAVDHRAFESLREIGGNRPAQPRVVHVDSHDAPSDHVRRYTAPGRFDFRKFGHG